MLLKTSQLAAVRDCLDNAEFKEVYVWKDGGNLMIGAPTEAGYIQFSLAIAFSEEEDFLTITDGSFVYDAAAFHEFLDSISGRVKSSNLLQDSSGLLTLINAVNVKLDAVRKDNQINIPLKTMPSTINVEVLEEAFKFIKGNYTRDSDSTELDYYVVDNYSMYGSDLGKVNFVETDFYKGAYPFAIPFAAYRPFLWCLKYGQGDAFIFDLGNDVGITFNSSKLGIDFTIVLPKHPVTEKLQALQTLSPLPTVSFDIAANDLQFMILKGFLEDKLAPFYPVIFKIKDSELFVSGQPVPIKVCSFDKAYNAEIILNAEATARTLKAMPESDTIVFEIYNDPHFLSWATLFNGTIFRTYTFPLQLLE